jgi:hypothetical protein
MIDTLVYSQYCDNCTVLLKLIATNPKLADRICFLSIDGESEEVRSKIREFLYVMQIDEVPALFFQNGKFIGKNATKFINQLLSGKDSVSVPPRSKSVPPGSVPFPTIMRNVAKPRQETQPGNTGPTFVSNSGPSNYAEFGRSDGKEAFQNIGAMPGGVGTAVQSADNKELPPELVPINTKEDNAKGNDMEKRLQEMMAERAALATSTKPPM